MENLRALSVRELQERYRALVYSMKEDGYVVLLDERFTEAKRIAQILREIDAVHPSHNRHSNTGNYTNDLNGPR